MSTKALHPVIVSVDWFRPAYLAGGPVASLDNLFRMCSDEFTFYVICSAFDIGNAPLQNINVNTWNVYSDNVNVFYQSHHRNNKLIWSQLFERFPDAPLYINGMFSWHYSILPLWYRGAKRKTIIAPRGMLNPGAIARSYFKKTLFLKLAHLFKLYKHVSIQATDTEEVQAAKKYLNMPQEVICQISNVPKPIIELPQKSISGIRVCMISRIHPIKNILGAIKIVNQLAAYALTLDIYGPIEDQAYWKQCLFEMKTTPYIKYCGIVQPNDITMVLHNYNVLLHPSFNENYGHSIAEALQCELAVLTGDATPWTWLNETGGGAAINPLNEKAFVDTLKSWLELPHSEFLEFCKKGARAFKRKYSFNDLRLKYRHLFYAS